ncbi:UNVERIFIED_CONTAM: hypothetical protein FKN15_026104 [Acipenser sinensis]
MQGSLRGLDLMQVRVEPRVDKNIDLLGSLCSGLGTCRAAVACFNRAVRKIKGELKKFLRPEFQFLHHVLIRIL